MNCDWLVLKMFHNRPMHYVELLSNLTSTHPRKTKLKLLICQFDFQFPHNTVFFFFNKLLQKLCFQFLLQPTFDP